MTTSRYPDRIRTQQAETPTALNFNWTEIPLGSQSRQPEFQTESMFPKYVVLFLSLHATLSCVTCNPDVNTTTAFIKGSEKQYDGKTVYQYMGIPFAKPPVKDLRFQKTHPLEKWSGTLYANVTRPACSQKYLIDYPVMDLMPGKSEDCLYLNIWVPGNASQQNPKAVMFWLYGVGFTTGSNRVPTYNGTVLAAIGDVIVVTPNYRLGIFGFLSTDSENAAGNMGLYDVLEALKWVNINIEFFGGDSNRITISGNTAGSLIGGLFTISPLTKGLFRRVIMESGADNTVRGNVKQYNLQLGQQIAMEVGCASESSTLQNNTDAVIECLKNRTAKELVTATIKIIHNSTVGFLPIYGDKFVPEKPSKAYGNGDAHNVDVLIGNCRDEGTFQLTTDYINVFGPYGEKNPIINKTYGTQLLNDILIKDNIDSNSRKEITHYYLSSVPNNDTYSIRHQVARGAGDVNIFCNDYYFALQFSKLKPRRVYFYYFIHRTPITKFANWTGVTIFSEVPYVFGGPMYESGFTDEEAKLSAKMVDLWSNFVKNGRPSPDWKTFNGSDDQPYVEILKVEGDLNDNPYQRFNNCKFLKKYILNYGKN